MASKKQVITSAFEVEFPPPVSRSELLDALDSLIGNYDRALHEGSWIARELAGMLAEVQRNLGVTKVHCIEIVDQICERAVAMRHTTRTADDQPVTLENALDSIVAELKPFLPDLYERPVNPDVRTAVVNSVRIYANPKRSKTNRAESVLVVIGLIKPSWLISKPKKKTESEETTVNSVRMAIQRSRDRRASERKSS